MPQGGGVLPPGYTQLQYIESTGTQYIITDITGAKNTWKWYFKTQSEFTIQPYQILHGLQMVNATSRIYSALRSGIYFDWICNSSYGRVQVTTYGTNWTETYEDSNSVTINGQTYSITKNSNTRNEKVMLLGSIYNSIDHAYGCGKYAIAKIWDENDTLIFNGIPALRQQDSKPGLYDTVNNVFYTNAGTGEFLYA